MLLLLVMLFLLYGEGTRERETNTAPARYSLNEKILIC
ncbi:hypothetical protein [Escherichia phage vB-Eco-KMB37]|nr:hypothetical protein [Escherichia phage vB-Eco-KMB37]